MPIRPLLALHPLSDGQLIEQLKSLVRRERVITLAVLLRLVEMERRGLHLRRYSSLFAYCTDRLGYSPSAAGRRIRAARCLRDFPRVYSMLLEGRINLTTLCIVARVLTTENEAELLLRVDGKPQAEVERVVAALSAPIKPRDTVRPIRLRTGGRNGGGVGGGCGRGEREAAGPASGVANNGTRLDFGSSSAGPSRADRGSDGDPLRDEGTTAEPGQTIHDPRACPRSETPRAFDRSDVAAGPRGLADNSLEGTADTFVNGAAEGSADSFVNGSVERPASSFVGCRADDSGEKTAEPRPDGFAERSVGPEAPGRGSSSVPSPSIPPSGSETPLSYRVRITVDASFVAKLERARAIVSRGRPNASLADVLDRALDEFLKRNDPQERMARRQQRAGAQAAVTETMTCNETMGALTVDPSPQVMSETTPQATQSVIPKGRRVDAEDSSVSVRIVPHRENEVQPSSTRREQREGRPTTSSFRRSIPAALRDEVLCRDGGRCTYVGPEGRCPETRGLQIDHIDPVVLGGLTELKNCRAICGPHNQSEADRVLGKDFMDLRRRRTPAPGVDDPADSQSSDPFTST